MAIRSIRTIGDEILTKECKPVKEMTPRTAELIEDMFETMYEANGVGLAAPQVGILRRAVIVVDEQDQMIELVNPVIIRQEGEQDGLEGCLSVPGMYGKVKRPNYVIVRAQDRDGNPFEVSGEGIVARCFCHETEHLDGHLFVEHTGRLYTLEELDAMEADGEELQ